MAPPNLPHVVEPALSCEDRKVKISSTNDDTVNINDEDTTVYNSRFHVAPTNALYLNVTALPSLYQPNDKGHAGRHVSSVHITLDDMFIVDCCDESDNHSPTITNRKDSPPPSSHDDGISMNYSQASTNGDIDDPHQGSGTLSPDVFIVGSSPDGNIPNHICICKGSKKKKKKKGNKIAPNKSNESKLPCCNAILKCCSCFGGGKKDDGDDGDSTNEVVVGGCQGHNCLGAGDSRASLVSLDKIKGKNKTETWRSILSEIGLPFLIAGLGMVGAGLLLDNVMGWVVFQEIGELVILVTPLLGLKGNLEMTLAARLSTQANIGNMDKATGNKWKICRGNLLLDQLQALVCGFFASFVAVLISFLFSGKFDSNHLVLVIVSSTLTASMVSIVLGSTMISVTLLCQKFKINPDNVATPVAGSLGDVVTLGMLSCFASVMYRWYNAGFTWVPYVLIGFYLCCLPVLFWATLRNEFTRSVAISGWIPLLVSVTISTGGGILLDQSTNSFPAVALYQPVINGIGGNLVSVQASRISSYLHGNCEKRILPNKGGVCETPWGVFLGKGINAMSARLLLFLAIPGHLLFSTITHYVAKNDDTNYGPLFLLFYVSAAVLQILLLLYIAKILTNLCWRRGLDPDSQTIPYLTAMGDFFGSGFLFAAFYLLRAIEGESYT